MKVKILTLAAMFFCSLIMVKAQTSSFQNGDKVLNLGIGFSGYGPSGYKVKTPSASASFEVALKNKGTGKGTLGIGGYIGYASYDQSGSYSANNYWSVSRILIGARGAFHYPLADKLDSYGGLTLGVIARSWKWNGSVDRSDHPSKKPIGGDLFIGSRYYFSDKFAVMGELGLGAYLTLGIAMKL